MTDPKPLTEEEIKMFRSTGLVPLREGEPFNVKERICATIDALRQRAERAEKDRDVLGEEVRAWRSVDKSAWEFSVDLLQAKSDTDTSAALARCKGGG